MFPYNILASAADKGLPEAEDPGTSRTSHAGCVELTLRADGDTEIWDKDLSMGTQEKDFFCCCCFNQLTWLSPKI